MDQYVDSALKKLANQKTHPCCRLLMPGSRAAKTKCCIAVTIPNSATGLLRASSDGRAAVSCLKFIFFSFEIKSRNRFNESFLEVPRELRLVSNQVNIHTFSPNAKLQRCSAICTSVKQNNRILDQQVWKIRKINSLKLKIQNITNSRSSCKTH